MVSSVLWRWSQVKQRPRVGVVLAVAQHEALWLGNRLENTGMSQNWRHRGPQILLISNL